MKRHGLKEIRRFIVRIKALMALGLEEWEIADKLELDWEQYNDIKKEMYRWEVSDLYDRPTEEHYLNYVIKQHGCLKDLDALIEACSNSTLASDNQTKLGAIRAKSDILDKVVKMGQEFNILEKAPERKQVVAGVVVAQLNNEDLKKAIAAELASANELIEKYRRPPELAPDSPDKLPAKDLIDLKAVEVTEEGGEDAPIEPEKVEKKKRKTRKKFSENSKKQKSKKEAKPKEEPEKEEKPEPKPEEKKPVEKPNFTADLKPFFSRNPAARARAAKFSQLKRRQESAKET